MQAFAIDGTHLARYASTFRGVEINSTFYRPHRAATFSRWADSVPDGFRFAVKMPRAITHELALTDAGEHLRTFFLGLSNLGNALGPVLVQLPPKLAYDRVVAKRFFTALRKVHSGPVVLEPRHESWFNAGVNAMLVAFGVAVVAADPARVPLAGVPAGYPSLVYYRLHGSPVIYRSSYDHDYLERLALQLRMHLDVGADVWCIFDNTMTGAATSNALLLQELLDTP